MTMIFSLKQKYKVIEATAFILLLTTMSAIAKPNQTYNQYRIYDQILGITEYMTPVYTFTNTTYTEVPTEALGVMTKKQAYNEYKKLADKNDFYALIAIGYCNQLGINCKSDEDQALNYWTKAHNKGFIPATGIIGNYYLDKHDNETALNYLSAASNANYIPAIKDMALCYTNGYGVYFDNSKGIELYKKAINLGDTQSLYDLAKVYEYEGDFDLYEQYLVEASLNGINKANYELYDYLYNPKLGYKKDLTKAYKYYLEYHNNLYNTYIKEKNNAEALLPYYEKLADKGDTDAILFMANYFNPTSGYFPDYERYIKYLLDMVDLDAKNLDATDTNYIFILNYYLFSFNNQNISKACKYLSEHEYYDFLKSIIIPYLGASDYVNYINEVQERQSDNYYSIDSKLDYETITIKEAFNYMKELADNDDVEAKDTLAYCYAHAIGCSLDKSQASYYGYDTQFDSLYDVTIPADIIVLHNEYLDGLYAEEQEYLNQIISNNADGQLYYNLAELYFRKLKSKENCLLALDYYKKAAELGCAEAFDMLFYYYDKGYYVEYNPSKALEYLRYGAAFRNEYCSYELFLAYSMGKGCTYDMEQALYWLYTYYKDGNTSWVKDDLVPTPYFNYLDIDSDSYADYSDADLYSSNQSQSIDWNQFGTYLEIRSSELLDFTFLPEWNNCIDVVSSFLAYYLTGDNGWTTYITHDDYIVQISETMTQSDLITSFEEEYTTIFADLENYSVFILQDYYEEDEDSNIAYIPVGLSVNTDGNVQSDYFYIVMYKDNDGIYSILAFDYN